MPPKKQKVKVRKTSKSGGKGVNIKIVIDQSKKTKGVAPKAPAQPRQLPAFSAMPQGPSFLGASYPARQDAPAPQLDTTAIGDRVFNQLLTESNRLRQSANGFGGFQNAGQQLNQIFDGEYRAGRNNFPIISNPNESSTTRSIDYAVFDDPETNNQILGNKLNNRGSMLPQTGENSVIELNAEDRRDNALDNLVLQEKKTKVQTQVDADFGEELIEEGGSPAIQDIEGEDAQAQRAKELALESQEAQYIGRTATPKIRSKLDEYYDLPSYPPPKKATLFELKQYINAMNQAFGTDYDTNFSGRKAVDDLRRVIRIGLLKAYDDL